jgi:predicted esterase
MYHSADEFFAAHPKGSVMGKMGYDTSRACDLLKALPQTKDLRIGCLGHSHGAYGTLFAMLNDDRIKAGVISCGLNLLRKDPVPNRWWRLTSLMPRLGLYAESSTGFQPVPNQARVENPCYEMPIDFHVWLAMLAPRPVLLTAGTQDQIFPNCEALRPALKMVAGVYQEQNAPQNFHTHIFDGAHSFPQEIRREAYDLLANSLKS